MDQSYFNPRKGHGWLAQTIAEREPMVSEILSTGHRAVRLLVLSTQRGAGYRPGVMQRLLARVLEQRLVLCSLVVRALWLIVLHLLGGVLVAGRGGVDGAGRQ